MAKKKSQSAKASAGNAEFVSLQDGNYSTSMWFIMFVAFVESKWPGSGAWLEAGANLIPWEKLSAAVLAAIADWQADKSFLDILKEAMSEWVVIEPGSTDPLAMTAKAPVTVV